MKNLAFGVLIVFTLVSWKADTSGPWVTTVGERVTLHTRPQNHSTTQSPDSTAINKIILEQEQAIDFINKRLNVDFNSRVEIFLYNYDEAKQKIGTNGGGFTSMNGRQIFFTYYGSPAYNSARKGYVYLGVHEMVHIVTLKQLGNIRNRFFGEGYANALDGTYGSKLQGGKLIKRQNDSTLLLIMAAGKLLKPSDLLYRDNIPEQEYYPQIGCLVNWLFDTYGVTNINKLFSLKRDKIEVRFHKVTGVKFADMEIKYFESLNYPPHK
jgi:hypothetical protein